MTTNASHSACGAHPNHHHPWKLAQYVSPGDVVSDEDHLYWTVTATAHAHYPSSGIVLELAGAEDGVNADRRTSVFYGAHERVTLVADLDPGTPEATP
jgi:hypothetical protein